MSKGSVIVDVAVDQGGCIETCRPDHARQPDLRGATASCTTASPNMPGAVPHTSTWALTNTTIPLRGQDRRPGPRGGGPGRRRAPPGFNTYGGHVTYEPVARAHRLEYVPARDLIA